MRPIAAVRPGNVPGKRVYDVSTRDAAGAKRLRNVAKACVAHGQRVQNSVFECLLSEAEFRELQHCLEQLVDLKHDSLRFYLLGSHYENKVIQIGAKQAYAPKEPLMI